MSAHAGQGATRTAPADNADQNCPDRVKAPNPRPGRKPREFLHPGVALRHVITRSTWKPAPPPRVPGVGPTWVESYFDAIERERARSLAAYMQNTKKRNAS
jgi:hypothetical protein